MLITSVIFMDSTHNCLYIVPNKDGGLRFITNLKKLNSFVQTQHFKIESITMLIDILRKGDYMPKVDLKDAYFMIPITKQHKHLMRFNWEKKTYQFNCLPFRLSSAPWVFTKTTWPFMTVLRSLGLRTIIVILSRVRDSSQGTHSWIDKPPREPRIYNQLPQITTDTLPGKRISGLCDQLQHYGVEVARGKDKENTGRDPKTSESNRTTGSDTIPPTRKIESRHSGDSTGSSLLPQLAKLSKGSPGGGGPRILLPYPSVRRLHDGTPMVGNPSNEMEWAEPNPSSPTFVGV